MYFLCIFDEIILKPDVCVLQSEKERWSKAIVQYEKQQKTLCGDVLLTSAFVSYMGYFTRQYRVELLNSTWIPFLRSQKVCFLLSNTTVALDSKITIYKHPLQSLS